MDCLGLVRGEIQHKYNLNAVQCGWLISLFNLFNFDEFISKTLFYTTIGTGGNWKGELIYPFNDFFEFVPKKGYRLTESGLASLGEFTTILRRVCDDREEFFRLKFGRYSPEEREKRRLAKPFYRDLTEEQQILVLREYYSLPYAGATPDETRQFRRVRKLKQIEIAEKYGLRNWDLINAIQRYGEIVKSVRRRPDIAHHFPRENRQS